MHVAVYWTLIKNSSGLEESWKYCHYYELDRFFCRRPEWVESLTKCWFLCCCSCRTLYLITLWRTNLVNYRLLSFGWLSRLSWFTFGGTSCCSYWCSLWKVLVRIIYRVYLISSFIFCYCGYEVWNYVCFGSWSLVFFRLSFDLQRRYTKVEVVFKFRYIFVPVSHQLI